MPINDKVKIADYNDIRNKVIGVLGTGFGNTGYGQAIRSSAVSTSTKVGVNDWANLYYDIYNSYVHQTGGAPPAPGTIVENEIVKYSASKPNNQYDNYANTLVANRFNIAGSQSSTTSKGSSSTTWPGVYGTYWNTLAQCVVTVSFSSSTAARYFFNSGGQIRFTSSRANGSASGQNTAWTNLLNAISSINGGAGPIFGGAIPAAGTEPNDGQNFYRLSSGWSAWYTASDSTPYGSNYFRIFARSPNVGDNSNGTDSQVQFLIYWVDGYVDPGTAPVPTTGYTPPASAFPPDDLVNGTLTLAVSTLFATGTLLPAGAPAFAVESPNVTIGAITS